MAALLTYLKQPNVLFSCTYIWLATLAVTNEAFNIKTRETRANVPEAIEMAALGRPLSVGMLYDCRKDSFIPGGEIASSYTEELLKPFFIPGVTLRDENVLSKDLETRPQPSTSLKFSSSDSLRSKFDLLDVSASLRASVMAGLVEVRGSAKYLSDTKPSNQQFRTTMFYSETTKYQQLTRSQLAKFRYPDGFDKKSATHVVTAVLYGAQAFMVFDDTFSFDEDELTVMVKKLPGFSTEGEGAEEMTLDDIIHALNINCTFHGDFLLEENPTTYSQAMWTYKKLPSLLKEKPENAVPIKVWLYPLHLLDNDAARLERQIRTELVSSIEDIIQSLNEAERTCSDLLESDLVKVFSDFREGSTSFQSSLMKYKTALQEKLSEVLPAIRGGEMEEKKLEDILKMHRRSPFNAEQLRQFLDEAKQEHDIFSTHITLLEGIETKDINNYPIVTPEYDVVVCFMLTSLGHKDPYLSTLKEFLKSDMFKDLDGPLFSVKPVRKWYKQSNAIKNIKANALQFQRFADANKDEKRMRFIISATSHFTSANDITGSSIYVYDKGILIDTKFIPRPKPPTPTLMSIQETKVTMKVQKILSTDRYRVECEIMGDIRSKWISKDTTPDIFRLTGLESGKNYVIRYRIADKVGWSEPSDPVHAFLAELLVVGGTGGEEFNFRRVYNVKKITVTYTRNWTWQPSTLNTMKVVFEDYLTIQIGKSDGWNEQVFSFGPTDKIVAATLWPNLAGDRLGGLQFVVEKNGKRETMSLKGDAVGEPVFPMTKSGKICGVKGRRGDEIDALGFYFC